MATAGDRYDCVTGNVWSYAHRGDLTGVKAALLRGGGVDGNSNKNNTNNNLINFPNTVGWTALHAAAAGGQTKVLRFLLREGADLSIADHGGNTAIHQAAKHGHVQALRVLESFGADLTTVRLSHAKGNAVRDCLVEALRKALPKDRKQDNGWVDDDDDDDDLSPPIVVGYGRKQAKSTAFWGPRKTPISGKIKRNILKQRRKRKQSQQQQTLDGKDSREIVVLTKESGRNDDDDDDENDCSSVEEDIVPSQKESLDRVKAAAPTDDGDTQPAPMSYHLTVQAVKRNKKQRRKGRQKQKMLLRMAEQEKERTKKHRSDDNDDGNPLGVKLSETGALWATEEEEEESISSEDSSSSIFGRGFSLLSL